MFKKWCRKRKIKRWKKRGFTDEEISLELALEDGSVTFGQYLTMKVFIRSAQLDVALEELTSYVFPRRTI